MKYWELIADNLSKAGWSWGYVSAVILTDEQAGLQTHKAPTAQAIPMLNSARRNCTSPRRGRRIEWSD
jgi:hypothetical protein